MVESFFSSLKKERIKKQIYPSREVALADIGRLHRYSLQSHPPAQLPGLRQPRGV